MLEELPHAIGHLLQGVRPGLEKTVYHDERLAEVPAVLHVTSPAFADGEHLPARFTDDGPGISPPLAWSGVPAGAASVVIIAEDPDSPVPAPLVHLIVHDLSGDGSLAEGAASSEPPSVATGTNSFFKNAWLPSDPPPGNGDHRYVFQVYALDAAPDLGEHPGRSAVVDALAQHAIAKGVLVGLYGRA